jgi:endonuclease/exonuclease/phosphatase family metal-dependent hydrolase
VTRANTITFLTNNMHQNYDGAWPYLAELAETNAVDCLLLQEAADPASMLSRWSAYPAPAPDGYWRIAVPDLCRGANGDVIPTRRRFGSIVVSTGQRRVDHVPAAPIHDAVESELVTTHPGQFAIARLWLDDGTPVTVVSLYGLFERMPDGSIYSDATLHRALSDLAPLLQTRPTPYVLVAGDLNIWPYTGGSRFGEQSVAVFRRFADYGLEVCGPLRHAEEAPLERCPCGTPHCTHVATYHFRSNPAYRPYQNDHVLATGPFRERLLACWADPNPEWYSHSDHRAIFTRFAA